MRHESCTVVDRICVSIVDGGRDEKSGFRVIGAVVVSAGRVCLEVPGSRTVVARVEWHQEGLSIEIQDGLRLACPVGKIAPAKLAHVRILCCIPNQDGLEGLGPQAWCDAKTSDTCSGPPVRALSGFTLVEPRHDVSRRLMPPTAVRYRDVFGTRPALQRGPISGMISARDR